MLIRSFICHLGLALASVSAAQAAETSIDYSYWVDKYPSDKLAANHAGLLEQPGLKDALKKVLPKQEWRALLSYSVETPAKKVDHYLVANKCQPHNCAAETATVVIDLSSQKIWVGFFTRESQRVATRWYGSEEDYSVLPETIKQEFLTRHGD